MFQEKDILKSFFKTKSLKVSQTPTFQYKDGYKSRFCVDFKSVATTSIGAYYIGLAFYEMLKEYDIKAIGGFSFDVDIMSIATLMHYDLKHRGMNMFSIQENQKNKYWLCNPANIVIGTKVAIISDMIRSGDRAKKVINTVTKNGFEVDVFVTLVDFEDGGIDEVSCYVDEVKTIFKISDFF